MIDEKRFNRLKARLAVDTLQLTEELMQLPSLQQEAAELAAEAQRTRDEVHDIAKQVEAEIKAQKRLATPGISEARLTSEVLLVKEVTESQEAANQADYELAMWKTLADGMRTKSSSIRTIADLIAAGYTSPDTVRNERLHEVYAQKPKGRNS